MKALLGLIFSCALWPTARAERTTGILVQGVPGFVTAIVPDEIAVGFLRVGAADGAVTQVTLIFRTHRRVIILFKIDDEPAVAEVPVPHLVDVELRDGEIYLTHADAAKVRTEHLTGIDVGPSCAVSLGQTRSAVLRTVKPRLH